MIKKFCLISSFKAFTLAEVLITLSIVGIVASLTIPTVLSNIGDIQHKIVWKKMYSDIDQATRMVMLENGGTLKDLCPSWDNNCFKDKYSKYLNYVKDCNKTQSWGSCWHKNDNSSKILDGTEINWWSDFSGLVLNNGAMIGLSYRNSACSESTGSLSTCGYIVIDTNGFKAPNVVGKDIFQIHLLSNLIKPRGSQGDGSENSCTSTTAGWSCAAEFLYN